MPANRRVIETRKITEEEAKQCAQEKVQFIGKIQPHGFMLVADSDSKKIVQYSENIILHINQSQSAELPENTQVLETNLFDWLDCKETLHVAELLSTNALSLDFGDSAIISPNKWECLASLADNYLLFDFFPSSKKQSAHNILGNLDRMVAKIRGHDSLRRSTKPSRMNFKSTRATTGY